MKKLLLHTILLFATCYLANQAIAAPWGFSHGMNTELLVTKLTGKAPNQTCVVDEKDAAFNEMLPDFDDPNKLRLLRLRDSGIDHLRLPIDMHFLYSPTLTANNDHLRADNVGKLLDYISAVNDKGLNVILDLHIARHVCGGNFGDTYSQFIEQKTKIVNGEEVYDPADLPALAGRHDAFVDFWRSLATQINLRIPYPNKVMLEPMNEPKFLNKQDDWLQFQDRLVKEIRQAAPQHRVIVTGSYWSNIDTLVGKLTSSGDSGPFNPVTPYIDPITGKLDDKIVYNFHFYEPMVLTHQGADWG
ncbi:MAG: cellulase family glycosylhydrolase, partial [Burkholderiales bacterium]|nr:cellulase family glycosylhydrolase [Burkholderiales bacterium]